MLLFYSVAQFTAYLGDLFFDAFFDFLDWLKVNDFSGSRCRKHNLDEAPASFTADKIPVVLGASKLTSLLYDERGFHLKNRKTGQISAASSKSLRRFTRRGMKGLRSESLKISRLN